MSKNAESRDKILSLMIKDKQALYMSFMPFVDGGGLFVPTKKEYKIGDQMYLLVKIMDEIDPIHISGKVIWINPYGVQGNKSPGIGVQFIGDDAPKVLNLIESKLGATVSLTRPTHTM